MTTHPAPDLSARLLVERLCGDDPARRAQARDAAHAALLEARLALWGALLAEVRAASDAPLAGAVGGADHEPS